MKRHTTHGMVCPGIDSIYWFNRLPVHGLMSTWWYTWHCFYTRRYTSCTIWYAQYRVGINQYMEVVPSGLFFFVLSVLLGFSTLGTQTGTLLVQTRNGTQNCKPQSIGTQKSSVTDCASIYPQAKLNIIGGFQFNLQF